MLSSQRSRLGGEIGAHMRIEKHRGPGVDDVERFDHVLPLALGISRHTSDVFAIHLPVGHGCWPLQRLLDWLSSLVDAAFGF